MRKMFARLAALCVASFLLAAAPPPKPKLVVLVAVDQFRYDYLTRFRAAYTAGLNRLLEQGAVFSNAHYEQYPTVTAVGHSIMFTGAMPAVSGIIGNDWYDRSSKRMVTSVADADTKLLGVPDRAGASPRRLLVSTVGDELKMANGSTAKVIGISAKDRSAILPAGHMADGAFWFDSRSGAVVSSTFYFPQLPAWVEKFNDERVVDRWAGKPWLPEGGGAPFKTLPAERGQSYYAELYDSPFCNDLLIELAERAVDAEKLGRNGGTDILTLSLSANDSVGHKHGPDSAQVRDISIKTDRALGRFFSMLDEKVGVKNTLIVFTADHGVSPSPEENGKRRMPGGRYQELVVSSVVENALKARFGDAKWVAGRSSGGGLFFDYDILREKRVNLAEAQQIAAAALRGLPYVSRVYTREDLLRFQPGTDFISRSIWNGYFPLRGPDVLFVPQPYWIAGSEGVSHSTPYSYDNHVPVIFLGPGIKPGRYFDHIAVNDIAPTVSSILEIEAPSGSSGRILDEILLRP
jgi:hypothetical protein